MHGISIFRALPVKWFVPMDDSEELTATSALRLLVLLASPVKLMSVQVACPLQAFLAMTAFVTLRLSGIRHAITA